MNWPLFLIGLHALSGAVFVYLCLTAPVMPAWMDR